MKILHELSGGVKLGIAHPSELEPIDKNARHMSHRQFKQLVENIRKDGHLSSTPLCLQQGGKFVVLSGNHRVEAAVAAGILDIPVLFYDRTMSVGELRAKQISHNEIVGFDDMAVLAELWKDIDDVTFKQYTGLDEEKIGKLEALDLAAFNLGPIETKLVMIAFLPEQKDAVEGSLKKLSEVPLPDEVWHGGDNFDLFVAAVKKIKKDCNVYSNAVALSLMATYALKHMETLTN